LKYPQKMYRRKKETKTSVEEKLKGFIYAGTC